LYFSISPILSAVCRTAGASDGFTTGLWLTEQPEMESHAAATTAINASDEHFDEQVALRAPVTGIERRTDRAFPSAYTKYPSLTAGRRRVNELGRLKYVSWYGSRRLIRAKNSKKVKMRYNFWEYNFAEKFRSE